MKKLQPDPATELQPKQVVLLVCSTSIVWWLGVGFIPTNYDDEATVIASMLRILKKTFF